jgi:hypothetical protein
MYERMLDKNNLPNVCDIQKYVGKKATSYTNGIIGSLKIMLIQK